MTRLFVFKLKRLSNVSLRGLRYVCRIANDLNFGLWKLMMQMNDAEASQ